MVDISPLPTFGGKQVNAGITGLKTLISMWGAAQDPDALSDQYIPLPYFFTNAFLGVAIAYDDPNITVDVQSDFTGYNGFVVMEYLK